MRLAEDLAPRHARIGQREALPAAPPRGRPDPLLGPLGKRALGLDQVLVVEGLRQVERGPAGDRRPPGGVDHPRMAPEGVGLQKGLEPGEKSPRPLRPRARRRPTRWPARDPRALRRGLGRPGRPAAPSSAGRPPETRSRGRAARSPPGRWRAPDPPPTAARRRGGARGRSHPRRGPPALAASCGGFVLTARRWRKSRRNRNRTASGPASAPCARHSASIPKSRTRKRDTCRAASTSRRERDRGSTDAGIPSVGGEPRRQIRALPRELLAKGGVELREPVVAVEVLVAETLDAEREVPLGGDWCDRGLQARRF